MKQIPSSARSAALEIRSGALKPEALLEFHLSQIDRLNPRINALRYINRAESMKLAEQRSKEAKAGKILGRAHGVVFTAKDSIDVAGLPRSDGSLVGAVDAAANNASIVDKLMREGAICIGKTNMAEYGKSYFTENPLFGITNNPFNILFSPGGSGGGDAAAVASLFGYFGLGADAGGSIRIPANFCGLFGLHPTRGAISSGSLTRFSHTTSQLFRGLGPITRTLDDLELLWSLLSGFDSKDPYSISRAPGSETKRKKRFAFFTELNGASCDVEIAAALCETNARLEEVGYRGEEYLPSPWKFCKEPFIILAAQAALMVEDAVSKKDGYPRDLTKEGTSMKQLRARIAKELPPLTAERVLDAWYTVDKLRHEVAPVFEKYDFILSPVTATLPPKHGATSFEVNNRSLQSQDVFQFASAVNVLGLPAISFPTGLSKAGLPIGLQLIGPRLSEVFLLEVLREAEFLTCVELANQP